MIATARKAKFSPDIFQLDVVPNDIRESIAAINESCDPDEFQLLAVQIDTFFGDVQIAPSLGAKFWVRRKTLECLSSSSILRILDRKPSAGKYFLALCAELLTVEDFVSESLEFLNQERNVVAKGRYLSTLIFRDFSIIHQESPDQWLADKYNGSFAQAALDSSSHGQFATLLIPEEANSPRRDLHLRGAQRTWKSLEEHWPRILGSDIDGKIAVEMPNFATYPPLLT